MKTNKYLHLWLPIMGLHALHQVEESISFWQWYIDFVDKIPSWLQLPRISENAHLVNAHPEYFVWASIGQLTLAAGHCFFMPKERKRHENCACFISCRTEFLLGMAHFDKLFYSFLFSCNGNLPYRCLFHSEMGSSGFKKVNL